MRFVVQQLLALFLAINASTSVSKNKQVDENLKEESNSRAARFLQDPFYERRLPPSSFFLQGGDIFNKRKFAQFLSLINENSNKCR